MITCPLVTEKVLEEWVGYSSVTITQTFENFQIWDDLLKCGFLGGPIEIALRDACKKKIPHILSSRHRGGWGGAKSELSSKPLKMSDFLDILKEKIAHFLRCWRQGWGWWQFSTVSMRQNMSVFFFICKHPLTGQLAVREIGENKSCNKVSLQIWK